MTASLGSAEERQLAPKDFVSVSRLLVHSANDRAVVYVREPCYNYCVHVLQPMHERPGGNAYFSSHHAYFKMAAQRQDKVGDETVYSPQWFTYGIIKSIHDVENWFVSLALVAPQSCPSGTFQVYQIIPSLREFAGHPALLPANGLTLLQARYLGYLFYTLFGMMDLHEEDFKTCRFSYSLLGTRLLRWSKVPEDTRVAAIWEAHPRPVTYQWFSSLRFLLDHLKLWVESHRFSRTMGFADFIDSRSGSVMVSLKAATTAPNKPGLTTYPVALNDYDAWFSDLWCHQVQYSSAPAWTTDPPPDHFHVAAVARMRDSSRPHPVERQSSKRAKVEPAEVVPGRDKKPRAQPRPDFCGTSALLEAIEPLAPNLGSIVRELSDRAERHGDSSKLRYPRLMGPNGKHCEICFKSAFAAPHNKCATAICSKGGRDKRLHIDLGQEEWRSKSTDYWDDLITWLKLPQVAALLRPSPALKALTPGANW